MKTDKLFRDTWYSNAVTRANNPRDWCVPFGNPYKARPDYNPAGAPVWPSPHLPGATLTLARRNNPDSKPY